MKRQPRKRRVRRHAMVPLEDVLMQIMGMSEAWYDGDWIIGWGTFELYRPPGWPTAKYILKYYGYAENASGWEDMVLEHIGIGVKSLAEVLRGGHAALMAKRWKLEEKPDYEPQDEQYLAMTYSPGFAICEATYLRTGRMMLR